VRKRIQSVASKAEERVKREKRGNGDVISAQSFLLAGRRRKRLGEVGDESQKVTTRGNGLRAP
jgi:hypothetical protein